MASGGTVCLLYHFFYPDDVVSARLFGDLAEGLRDRGWHVRVLTSNRLRRRPKQSLPTGRAMHDGIEIQRVWRPRWTAPRAPQKLHPLRSSLIAVRSGHSRCNLLSLMKTVAKLALRLVVRQIAELARHNCLKHHHCMPRLTAHLRLPLRQRRAPHRLEPRPENFPRNNTRISLLASRPAYRLPMSKKAI